MQRDVMTCGGGESPKATGHDLRVVIAGTYVKSDAYPNVVGRIGLMVEDERLDVVERGHRFDVRLDYGSRMRLLWSAASAATRLLLISGGACVALWRERTRDVAYLPYPAVFVLYLLSLLPCSARPRRLVVDAFISLYDTVVIDRRLLRTGSLPARLLRHVERRAFRTASVVVVDTDQNARHYASVLGIDLARFVPMPLSLEKSAAETTSCSVQQHVRLRVLFVGTMVPLHGIDTLCEAIERLPRTCPVDIRLIGDGQEAPIVERLVTRLGQRLEGAGPKLDWIREWQCTSVVLREVGEADLCIGILGTTAKAQRVWPYKNYLYMAQGRALVTARTPVALELERRCGVRCFFDVPPGGAAELAALIERLARERSSLAEVGHAGRACYEAELSARSLGTMLFRTLAGSAPG